MCFNLDLLSRRSRLKVLLTVLALFLFVPAYAQNSLSWDFDQNTIADFGFVDIRRDGRLVWRARDPFSTSVNRLGVIGSNGDHLAPANWSDPGRVDLAVVSKVDEEVVWRFKSGDDELTIPFGSGDLIAIAGADFNGNQIADIAIAKANRRKLQFDVAFDPVTKGDASDWGGRSFGRVGDLVFYANPDNSSDFIGWVRKIRTRGGSNRSRIARVKMMNPVSNARRSVRLGRFGLQAESVLPLKQAGGEDLLVVLTDNRYRVIDFSGEVLSSGSFTSSSIILVGEYLTEAGEELAIIPPNGGDVTLVNPVTSVSTSVANPGGVPFDQVNVNSFGTISDVSPRSCPELRGLDGGGGFLWKDSDFHPGIVILTPANYNFNEVQVIKGRKVISTLTYTGRANENRQHWRDYSRPTRAFPDGSIVLAKRRRGANVCWLIESAAGRND